MINPASTWHTKKVKNWLKSLVLYHCEMAPPLVEKWNDANWKKACWHELSMHSVTGSTIIKTLNLSSSVSYYPSDEGSRKPKRSVGSCNKSLCSRDHFYLSHIAMQNNGQNCLWYRTSQSSTNHYPLSEAPCRSVSACGINKGVRWG